MHIETNGLSGNEEQRGPGKERPAVAGGQQDRPGLVLLSGHWLTLLGLFLVITAICTWFFVLPSGQPGHGENPYKGLVVYVALPAVFFLGLLLSVLGVVFGRRRILERLQAGTVRAETMRQRLVLFLALTIGANILIGSQATYRAITYMDTPQFCGGVCHSERPEFVAHRDSAHASVPCAECHIAPGQKAWIEAKMNGTRQLWSEIRGTYAKPVPPALASGHLVPSRETCQHCHWAEKIVATRLVLLPSYASDEHNTASYTVLLMLVGGARMPGIHHAHFAGGYEIRYAASDAKLETIPWVEWRDPKTGETRTYLSEGTKPEQAAALPKRMMQCVDCHNRPTHDFPPTERALDRALALGVIPSDLPFIRKQGLAVLQAAYPSSAEAAARIPAAIEAYYAETYPQIASARKADVAAAGRALLALHDRNVYPDLRVTWGTYPNNLGHMDSPGCFRCHDGSHTTADKKHTISQDCGVCHTLLAQQETSPEILKTLGVSEHIAAMKKP
jgi:nitrate/TMAO reductase-like tetraheme cytochrome c subunit